MADRLSQRSRILGDREARLRADELRLFEALHAALERFGADVTAADAQKLREATAQLEELFLIVVAGEFNSGKSSFINALLGERILPEGVTPTTDRINLLRWGESVSERPIEAFLLERTHPSPILKELLVVDTPGTNAVIRQHEALTRNFVPRSDLVLFVTSADRPFTESERTFLEQIRQWGKKIVLILNKVDILEPAESAEVVRFVRTHALRLLEVEPEVFPVSSRGAIKARESGDASSFATTGLPAVERYLLETLDQAERVRLKLLNPLGIGLKLAQTYRTEARQRLETLAGDMTAIDNIEGQRETWRSALQNDVKPSIRRFEAILEDLEARGLAFFDRYVRIDQVRLLLSAAQMQAKFRDEVMAGLDREIDTEVQKVIDWLLERNIKLWNDVNSYLDRRRLSRHREEMIGEVGQSFHYDRQALIERVGQTAERGMGSFNREAEAVRLAAGLRDSLTTTALAEVGAVGLGALLVGLLHGALADFTGLLFATLVAVGGLYILPMKRRSVKREFSARIGQLRGELERALVRQVDQEIDGAVERVREAVAPYTRFVRFQREQLSAVEADLARVEEGLLRVRGEIEAPVSR